MGRWRLKQSNLVFAREFLDSRLIREIEPFADLHYFETHDAKGKDAPSVSWETYLALQDAGILHTFTARADAAGLAGYAFYKILAHPHHLEPPIMMAFMDRLYLHPEHRGNGAGSGFIRYTEQELKPYAATIVQHVTSRKDFSKKLLMSGYVESAVIFIKDL